MRTSSRVLACSFARAHQQGRSVQGPLRERLITRQIALGENVGVVHVGQDANDPAALRADARNLNERIRPHDMPVYGVLAGEQLLRPDNPLAYLSARAIAALSCEGLTAVVLTLSPLAGLASGLSAEAESDHDYPLSLGQRDGRC